MCRLGPRDFDWRATDPATLVWAEALDGGDWNITVPNRDKIMLLKAPFAGAPAEIERTAQRYGGFDWSEKPGIALLDQEDENRHWRHTDVVDIDDLNQKPRTLWDPLVDDSYARSGESGVPNAAQRRTVMRPDGDSIFLSGRGLARRDAAVPGPAESRDARSPSGCFAATTTFVRGLPRVSWPGDAAVP